MIVLGLRGCCGPKPDCISAILALLILYGFFSVISVWALKFVLIFGVKSAADFGGVIVATDTALFD